jgi:hypothetical protein
MAAAGCAAKSDASREQLISAIKECGVARADVRPGKLGDSAWVWYWAYDDGVEGRKMNCVRDVLASQNVEATFFDRSFETTR